MQIYPYINRPKVKPQRRGDYSKVLYSVKDYCENIGIGFPGVVCPFWEGAGKNILNYGNPVQNAGHFTLADNNLDWTVGQGEIQLKCDGSQIETSAVGIESPDPGFWHDAFNKFSFFFVGGFIAEGAALPHFIVDVGGSANGIAIIYKAVPNTLALCTAVSGGYHNVATTTSVSPNTAFTLAGTYDGSDASGMIKIYYNGFLEATVNSVGASILAHSGEPGIGSVEGANAFNQTPADCCEWGGTISNLIMSTTEVFTADQIWLLHQRPYAMYEQKRCPTYFFVDSGAPPATTMPVFIHHQNQMRA